MKDINTQPVILSSEPHEFLSIGPTTFFVAWTPLSGYELWKTDGTAAGTALVKDINPGPVGSNPASLTAASGVLFFTADDGSAGVELWRSDGTAYGTTLVREVFPAPSDGFPCCVPGHLTEFNGRIIFLSEPVETAAAHGAAAPMPRGPRADCAIAP